jgi:hypothetical protein
MTALYVPVDEDHPMRNYDPYGMRNYDPYGLSKETDEATRTERSASKTSCGGRDMLFLLLMGSLR